MSRLSNNGGSMPKAIARERTYDAAAEIDSFITSRRLPVTVMRPLPGIDVPSMVSSSPPTSVQARPVTTPTRSSSSISRSEEHTSELQSHVNLVCRLLLEKKKQHKNKH